MRPPDELLHRLVDDPSPLTGFEWHEAVGSTNELAAAAAAREVPEIHLVLADVQTAGRGRRGRGWTAPPGTSLLLSLVTRPRVAPSALPLLPLLTGLALAEAVDHLLAGPQVALKWPNDLLLDGRKAAGILVEALPALVTGRTGPTGAGGGSTGPGGLSGGMDTPDAARPGAEAGGTGPASGVGAVIVGVGVNVDWRGVERPEALAAATSLAEGAGEPVDRWVLLERFVTAFGERYRAWQAAPAGYLDFLDDYRRRSATLGTRVRVEAGGEQLSGDATGIGPDGSLELRADDGRTIRLVAGDVEHLRPL